MARSLVIRNRRAAASSEPYRLDVRTHGLADTDYRFVCGLNDACAAVLLRTGTVRFLHGAPDPVAALAASGCAARLVLSWDRETVDDSNFVLRALGEDGNRTDIARMGFSLADDIVETGRASWELGHPMADPEFLRDLDWRRAQALRAEAERLERRAGR